MTNQDKLKELWLRASLVADLCDMADGAGLISGEAAVRIRTAAHQVRRWTERCYRDAINGGDGND